MCNRKGICKQEQEWEIERDRLFAEQERDLQEAESQGWQWISPPLSEADYIQMLYQEWQERHGKGD